MKFLSKCILICCLASGFQAQAATISCPSDYLPPTDGTDFVPSGGFAEIAEDSYGRYIYQFMYWHEPSRQIWLRWYTNTTYEPDAIFYNHDGKSYAGAPWGYWASDLPRPYVDTQFRDPDTEKVITIGSAQSYDLNAGRWYYTVTRFSSGAGSSSWVKLSSQRGLRLPSSCFTTWCSFGCDTRNNYRTVPFSTRFTAPGCIKWYWKYEITTSMPC